jgi:hypothetical protein
MKWAWRSNAYRRMHRRSSGEAFRSCFEECLVDPLRLLLQKVILPYRLRADYIDLAADFKVSQGIVGDCAEFGVYTGHSFIRMYREVTRRERSWAATAPRTRFFAFDSFQGLPEIGPVDSIYKQFNSGGLAATEEEFTENLRKAGIGLDKVQVVRGWYAETLSDELAEKLRLEKVAIAYIDCDLYESAVPVLRFLTNLLVDGAVLIFDDWDCFRANPSLGVRRAFSEWRAANRSLTFSEFCPVHGSHQKALIVHRPVAV